MADKWLAFLRGTQEENRLVLLEETHQYIFDKNR